MTKTTVGREPIQIVEIVQPFCDLTFGSAPCTATGTNDQKCYNTRRTCLDTANFTLASGGLSLYFGKGHVAELGVSGVDYLIPSLLSVSTSPSKINLAGANPDAQGLGNRALAEISFLDHRHSDRVVDPYVSGRSWDPLSSARGSFWTRWRARNPFYTNTLVKIYEGYAGEALGSMVVRTYILQEFVPPGPDGVVRLKCKDIIARIEERKAQAPLASPGELFTDINSSVTSFEVVGAAVSEYSATGTIIIDDELMTYSALATSANGLTFTISARGTDGTTADSHQAEASVQECLRYTAQRVDTIATDLLTNYGEIDASFQDTANWATEVDNYLPAYLLTTIITEPTSVIELLSQLQIQAGCYFWWSEHDALIRMRAVRGVDSEPDVVTDANGIIEGSVSFKERPRERISQIYIYYNRVDYTRDIEDPKGYESLVVFQDAASEQEEQYGEPSIRKIYANWLPNGALASTTASKIITRYREVPTEITFSLDAKDRDYWTGDTIELSHHLDVDQFGERRQRRWTIISAEERVPGEVVEYKAQDTTLYGEIRFILATGAGDYPGADTIAFGAAYITDDDGLLSDGTEGARIT